MPPFAYNRKLKYKTEFLETFKSQRVDQTDMSRNQISSKTVGELAMRARESCSNLEVQQGSHPYD